MGDLHAELLTGTGRPKDTGGRGAVEEDLVIATQVEGGDDCGTTVPHEPDVSDAPLVEDGVDGFPIVASPFRLTPEAGSSGRW